MTHLRFRAGFTQSAERRLLFMSQNDNNPESGGQKDPDLEKVLDAQKKRMEDMQKNLDAKQKELEASISRLEGLLEQSKKSQSAAGDVLKKEGQRDPINNRLQGNPQYRSYYERSLGKQAYYPGFTYSNGSITANRVPEGALNHYKVGHVVHRIDPTLGRIEFRMQDNGQWATSGVIEKNEVSYERTQGYQRAQRARDIAQQQRNTMLQRKLNAARSGQPLGPRQNWEKEYEMDEYLRGMARGESAVITNDPFLINNPGNIAVERMTPENQYLVPGTSDLTPVYRRDDLMSELMGREEWRLGKPRTKAQEDLIRKAAASAKARGERIDELAAELRRLDAGEAGGANVPSESDVDSPKQRFDSMRPYPNAGDKTAGGFERRVPVQTVSASREVSGANGDFPPMKFDATRRVVTQEFVYYPGLALNNSFDGRGGSGQRIKVKIPQEIAGTNTDAQIMYYVGTGKFRTEYDRMLANKAGVSFAVDNRNGTIIVRYTRNGHFSAMSEAGETNSGYVGTGFQDIDVKAEYDPVDPKTAAREEAKYVEADELLAKGTWGKIPKGTKDSKKRPFMYRMTGAVLQAYSPFDGLYQYDRATSRWFVTGKPVEALDIVYNDVNRKKAAPPSVAQAESPPTGDVPEAPTKTPKKGDEKQFADS